MTCLFNDIIKLQIDNKNNYIKNIYSLNNYACISIIIENNKIINIIEGKGFIHPTRKKQFIKFINNMLNKYDTKNIIVNINLSDIPKKGIFNFCRVKNDNRCFLIPTFRFTESDIQIDNKKLIFDNYDLQKEYIKDKINIKKYNKIYTNCICHKSKVDYFKYCLQNKDICDGYCWIGSVHKLCGLNNNLANELCKNNFAGIDKVYWDEHLKYKYVLYNDGNTLSDRMKLLLCTNSVIIKKQSIYEEFFTYKLKNNENYIEYNNENELRDIYNILENNNNLYKHITDNNNYFINNILTYDQCLLYFNILLNNL